MNLLSLIRDKWTQSTYQDDALEFIAQERAWNDQHIRKDAHTIKEIFHGFKYIVEVDYYKLYSVHQGANGWLIPEEFRKQYFYPHRILGEHAVVHMMRGDYTNDEYMFTRNEFGLDGVFVATNIEADAMVIALKYK